jgi:hypothetical protein
LFSFGKGSFGSKYTQLFTGFGVSAIIHGAANSNCSLSYTIHSPDFRFFILQAVAIFIEDHIIKFARQAGIRDSAGWRGIGYIWTVAWLSYTLKDWIGFHAGIGGLTFAKPLDPFGLRQYIPHGHLA